MEEAINRLKALRDARQSYIVTDKANPAALPFVSQHWHVDAGGALEAIGRVVVTFWEPLREANRPDLIAYPSVRSAQGHTPDCLRDWALRDMEQEAWVLRWPDYCRLCNGYGVMDGSYDPSPAGVGLSPGYIQAEEFCPVCSARGLCPRCGKAGLTNEEDGRGTTTGDGPCAFCGWNDDDDGLPPPYECAGHEQIGDYAEAVNE